MPRRARRSVAAVLGALLVVAFMVTAGPAQAGSSTDIPTRSDLAALRAKADRAAASLVSGTAALERVQAHTADLTRRARLAAKRSAALGSQLGELHSQLGAVAAAAYRNPMGGGGGFLMISGSERTSDTLASLSYLNVVSARRAEQLRLTATTRVRAEQAQREARQLAREADQASADATRRVAALRRQAAVVGEQLSKAVDAYAAEQERRRRAEIARRARAARAERIVVTGSCTGGGGRQWGGYPNGFIPAGALSPLAHASGQRLRCDAAAAFNGLTRAYANAHGGEYLCVTDSYRSYHDQQRLYRSKPSLAAVPGTSNHGWALAVDLCGGAQRAGSAVDRWLKANAGRFGWQHPSWAEPSGSRPEPWHWEFGHIS